MRYKILEHRPATIQSVLLSNSGPMGFKYTLTFKACAGVALNAPVVKRAPRAYTWASCKINLFGFLFSPIRVYQIDAQYVILGIITVLNIFRRVR